MQKVIGLVGYVNKTELIINLAKVLSITGRSVLVIDGTVEERTRYTIPAFNNSEAKYLVNFDGVDYALGFTNIVEVKEYICTKTSDADTYDIILLDIDNTKSYNDFRTEEFSSIFFFMEYSNISFAKNAELLQAISSYVEDNNKPVLTQVLYRQYITRTSEKYFQNIMNQYEVEWNERTYELPFVDQDKIADIEMQQSGFIDVNRHSKQFINMITDMAADIIGDIQASEIRRILKLYARGRT